MTYKKKINFIKNISSKLKATIFVYICKHVLKKVPTFKKAYYLLLSNVNDLNVIVYFCMDLFQIFLILVCN